MHDGSAAAADSWTEDKGHKSASHLRKYLLVSNDIVAKWISDANGNPISGQVGKNGQKQANQIRHRRRNDTPVY